ncbi:MAG: pilus assembly protein PilM [Oscillospiraceae bacterium]
MVKSKRSHAVGLVMDAAEIRAVELAGLPQAPRLVASGCAALPEGLLVDGLFTDVPAAGALLSRLLRENSFSGAPLIIGAKNQNVLLRMASFSKVPADKMRNAVMYQAQQFIPIPVADLVLDYVECSEQSEGERPSVNLLLVGAKKVFLDNMLGLAQSVGHEVRDVDSAILASVRAVVSSEVPAGEAFLLADIDHETLSMMIVCDGEILMARAAAHSARFQALAHGRHEDLTLEDAAIGELAALLENDIRASLHYYAAQGSAQVSHIYMIGRFAQMDQLIMELNACAEVPVTLPNLYPALQESIDTIRFGTCISLALRGLGGNNR